MSASSQQLGQTAEAMAAHYLQNEGFSIMARNYRYQRAEIDIIAQKDRLLIFVEVKSRSNDRFGHPETFVTPHQQALICTTAEHYIISQDWCHAIRFDVIAIQISNHQAQLTHFEDAFY